MTIKVAWTGHTLRPPYIHLDGVSIEGEDFHLTSRASGRPSMVAVLKSGDYRLKLFAGKSVSTQRRRGSVKGDTYTVMIRGASFVSFVADSPTRMTARFDSEERLREVIDVPASSQPAESAAESLDRPDVPEPEGAIKLPHCMFRDSKRHDAVALMGWRGRLPPQLHHHLRAPVLQWRDGTMYGYGSHLDKADMALHGETLSFHLADPGAHEDTFTCAVDEAQMNRIRRWYPPESRWQPPKLSQRQIDERIERLAEERGDEYLDACVETRFSPDARSEHLSWEGDVSDWPEWMEAMHVKLTPPMTGGGWHCVDLQAGGLVKRGYPPIRLNDVWLLTGPGTDGGRSGHVLAYCDPAELAEIRSFGDEAPDDDLTLPNEPIRVRTMRQVRALHLMLAKFNDRKHGPGLPSDVYRPWRDDCQAIQRACAAMCGQQGQADFYRRKERECEEGAGRYERRTRSQFERRPKAYRDYTVDEWLAEVPDLQYVKPRYWMSVAKKLRADVLTCRQRAETLEANVEEARQRYDAAIGRIEEREAEWADLVALLYPA